MRSDVIQIRWYSSGGCKTQNRGRPSTFGFVQSQGDHTWLELPPRSKESTELQGLGINHNICDLPSARLSSKTIRENCKQEQFETPPPTLCADIFLRALWAESFLSQLYLRVRARCCLAIQVWGKTGKYIHARSTLSGDGTF